jgi:hypothetical protein
MTHLGGQGSVSRSTKCFNRTRIFLEWGWGRGGGSGWLTGVVDRGKVEGVTGAADLALDES